MYVGWAGVRGGVHKCVCNVGFSPTFTGAENPEKIVEAHILQSFDEDFYGETMRLLLLGLLAGVALTSCPFGGLLECIRARCSTKQCEKQPRENQF